MTEDASDGLQDIGEWIGTYVASQVEYPTEPLFHYTSAEGLQGIVESRRIIATNVRFFSDSTELAHGWSFCTDHLESWRGDAAVQDFFSKFRVSAPQAHFLYEAYATCFTTREDYLPQWRGYGAHGAGYAIQFDPSRLRTLVMGNHNLLFGAVIYDDEKKAERVRAIVDAVACGLSAELKRVTHPKEVERVFMSAAAALATGFSMFGVLFKDRVFESECEYRLVEYHALSGANRPIPEFRTAHGVITPYILFPIERAPEACSIVAVMCGPTINHTAAQEGVQAFLAKANLPALVPLSRAPLRF